MADSGTLTPEILARRLKIAEQLLDQSKQKPITHWAEGLNELAKGYVGGKMLRDVEREQLAGEAGANTARMNFLGLNPAVSGVAGALSSQAAPSSPAPSLVPGGARPVQVIEGNAEAQSSPLDPPSNKDRDTAIRTIYGEDPGASAAGVANVLRRRAIDGNGGSNLTDVAKAPGQFEPWMRPDARARMENLDPNGPTYQRLGAVLDGAYAPGANDPTNGATHFFAPKAQAALGRDAPKWATGPVTTMGPHAFYGGNGPEQQSVQVAGPASIPSAPAEQAAIAAPASAAPAAAPIVDPQANSKAQIAAMLNSPNAYVRKQGAAIADALVQKQLLKSDPKFHRLNDEQLFDENTGKTIAAGSGFKPIVDPAERASHGIPAEDKRPYQLGPGNKLINPPAETRLNIDQRAESAYDTAAAKHVAERHDKLVQAGMEAKALRGDVNALRDIGSRITTGKTAEVTAALGPYAEALGIKIDTLPDLQAYDAIVAKMAPRMRVAGSGATSDYEMRQYLKAIPGLGKTPEGNAMIESTMEAFQDHQEKAAEIGSMALNKEITARQADKMLRELPDPLTAWKKAKGKFKLDAAPPVSGTPDRAAIEAEMQRRNLL